MIMNNDYFNLYLEKIRLLNYIYKYRDEEITLSSTEFASLFLIGEDDYNNPQMNPVDVVSIKLTMEFKDDCVINQQNSISILDMALETRIPADLNRDIAYLCMEEYNRRHEKKVSRSNIDRVLDSIE